MTGSLVAVKGAARGAARAAARRGARATADPGPDGRDQDAQAAWDAGKRDPNSPPLLTVSGLNCSYGHLRALDDINLDVRSGELVALAGENGAGKTTLVRCI
ncbi:MAG TPA: ATP-binding cassette domain-containing protein, partial [Streptosporangiaceae bacterium]